MRMRVFVSVLFAAALSLGCQPPKETPGPDPPPVPIATEIPAGGAVCKTDVPGSYTRCKDAAGEIVTCPVDTASLPDCAD